MKLFLILATFCVALTVAAAQFENPPLTGNNELPADAFRFDFNSQPNALDTPSGTLQIFTANDANPGLFGTGTAIARVTLESGAQNLPHFHPRASEMLYVIKGTVRACFAEENGGGLFCNDLRPGMAMVFPTAHIHYQQNVGDSDVEFIAFLNSENPGATTLPSRLFALPSESLASAFGETISAINDIRSSLPAGPAPSGPMSPPAASLEDALDNMSGGEAPDGAMSGSEMSGSEMSGSESSSSTESSSSEDSDSD